MSDKKILSLRGHAIPQPNEPNAQVVASLERLLEQARSGEVFGVAWVMTWPDGAVGRQRVGGISVSMLGECALLQSDLVNLLTRSEPS